MMPKNTPHWAHEDESSLGDRIVLAIILVAIIVMCVGLGKGWFGP
jgi:hypothetical protein